MIRNLNVNPATHAALRTLLGRAVERIFVTGDIRVVRRLRDDARTLTICSDDGRRYSGILVVHGNVVTTGLVVPTEAEGEVVASESSCGELGLGTAPRVRSARLATSESVGEVAR